MRIPFCLLLLLSLSAYAQKMPSKGVKPKLEDFKRPVLAEGDSSVHAVVLENVGHTKFVGNNFGWLSHETNEHRRVYVVDAQGSKEGNFTRYLRSSTKDELEGGQKEELLYLSGYVWNVENGEVKEYRLDKASIFRSRDDKNYEVVRFSLPNVKVGSIIEVDYSIISPYYWQLPTRYFQEDIPVRHSRYTAELPGIYNYLIFRRGAHPFSKETEEGKMETYTFKDYGAGQTSAPQTGQMNLNVRAMNWEVTDLPPIRREQYVSSMRNHVKSVSFQLASVTVNNRTEDRLGTWPTAAKRFYNDPEFGQAVRSRNNFFKDEVNALTAGTNDDSLKAAAIFAYVRSKFSCDDHSAIYLSKPLRQTWNTRKGSVADLNLLLVAMLNQAGLNAAPAIFATRGYGSPAYYYPIMDQYDYITAAVSLNNKWSMLDASHKYNGFGHLPYDLYNGYGRILFAESTLPVPFMADSLVEQQRTAVFMGWNPQGVLELNHQVSMGEVESGRLRHRLSIDGKPAYQKQLAAKLAMDAKVSEVTYDLLDSLEANVMVSAKAELPQLSLDSIIYLNPVIGYGYTENPFKSPSRNYPVEMDYPLNSAYTVTINIPEGYAVDELPKSERVRFNEDDGFFEYRVVSSPTMIQMRCITKLNKATFPVEDYESVRSFFSHIVRKQQEMIVLKKVSR